MKAKCLHIAITKQSVEDMMEYPTILRGGVNQYFMLFTY